MNVIEPMSVEIFKNTGLEFIRGSTQIIFKRGGVVITAKEFEDWSRDNTLLARVIKLAQGGSRAGYDFEAARTLRVIKRLKLDGTRDESPAQADDLAGAVEAAPVLVEAPEEPVPEHADVGVAPQESYGPAVKEAVADLVQKHSFLHKLPDAAPSITSTSEATYTVSTPKEAHKSLHTSLNLIIAVLVIVGVGSAIMSGYHITAYMENNGRLPAIAYTTGIIMTLFSAVAFSSAGLFWSRKGIPNRLIAAAFATFGVAVVAFAMFATMKVNYDQFKASDDAKLKIAVQESTAVKSSNVAEETLKGEVAGYDQRIKDAQTESRDWSRRYDAAQKASEASPEDKNLAYTRNSAKNSYNAALVKIESLAKERKPYADKLLGLQLGATNTENTVVRAAHEDSIFGMFSSVLGVEETSLKFVIYAIPAVFYDLMSPFALTVVLMLWEQRKRGKEEPHA